MEEHDIIFRSMKTHLYSRFIGLIRRMRPTDGSAFPIDPKHEDTDPKRSDIDPKHEDIERPMSAWATFRP